MSSCLFSVLKFVLHKTEVGTGSFLKQGPQIVLLQPKALVSLGKVVRHANSLTPAQIYGIETLGMGLTTIEQIPR